MNFYDLNRIIEQSKVAEQVVNRPGFTPTGKPVTPSSKPPVTGAKPPVTGHPASLENLARSPKRAKIKRATMPPTCPSFGCREPEPSQQKIVKDIKDLKPNQKQQVDKLVQSFTK